MGRMPSSLLSDRKTDDLRQLHVARPQDAGISGGQIGAQQVVSVTPFRRLEFFLVHMKLECLPRYLLAFGGHLQVHELEGAARCRFRGAQTHQQLDQGRQAPAHGPSFLSKRVRRLRRMAVSLARLPSLLADT
jgi:hypothetical protein